ncbi:hypothetical protein N7492_001463 [Penicillium capsulatum]|uniref:Fungal specific transcription factor n=1 Tax=Penicillium capsulatum TaxID=69766 RepID=A0A9W9M161_9EURO|nr:hypothetical protein N7492_001463 [Penicillium capsulatum]
MSDLFSSRWAPSASESSHRHNYPPRRPRSANNVRSAPTPPTTNNTGLLPPAEELARFMKIVARLRWKLPFLAEGYRLATQVANNGVDMSPLDVSEAEIMFKIDFHEYYALLERAIVHLLAVFNISVSSVGGKTKRATGLQSNGREFYGSAGIHRYHANVLDALTEETTPPYPDPWEWAKELRNRWKTADMTQEEKEGDPWEKGRAILPLASYNFEEIFSGIFAGLEESYVRARSHVDMCRRPGDVDGGMGSEADWDFMVDAMDWESV